MTVYNYVRVGAPGGAASIHDASPEVAAAIESWLEAQDPAESARGVSRSLLPEPGLDLLVLRHAISSEDPFTLRLVHVVAVPGDGFAEASPAAQTRFFESLYGSPLAIALSKLLGALARASRDETAARVREGFAGQEHLEALAPGSEDSGDVAPSEPVAEPAARDGNEAAPEAGSGSVAEPAEGDAPPPPRRSGRLAAGLGLLGATLGIALAYSPFADRILPGLDSPAPETQQRLDRLEQRVDRLLEEGRATRSAFAELQRSSAEALSQLRQGLEALRATARAVATAPTPAPQPTTAAAPAETGPRVFRVVARSARVRTGPSAKNRTRGLLGRGQRVLVTDQQDAWLEIEPPPGFRAPSWIHRTLVEAVEAPAGEAAQAAPGGPPPA